MSTHGPRPTVREPARHVPVIAETDVLVVGGGSAGLAAAVAAARNGARTMLIERYGYLGGLASGGLIILLLTLDDGRGRQVVAGLCQELVDRLDARDAAYYPPPSEWGATDPALVDHYRRWGLVWGRGPHNVRYSVAFDPEELKFIANDMVAEAGVRLRYHTWAVDALVEDDAVTAVICESKAGREAIRARVVIDTTGDGDLFARAGEPFEKELVHPWLWFRMGNVHDVPAAQDAAEGAFFQTPGEGRVLLPWGAAGRIDRRIDATDPDDLTHAEVECRRMVMEEAGRLRRVPGFERAHLTDIALTLGITESRRLLGRYQLAREDMDRPFPDTVAVTGHWTKYGAVYHIPYRSLLPGRIRNLLTAGRCISVDHRVHHATKEIPACVATGEAAGTAAALALRAGVSPGDLDVSKLQSRLREGGSYLGE